MAYFLFSYSKTIKMEKKQTNRGRNQDRSKVAEGQDYELNYEKNKLNVSGEAIKKTIQSTGNSRKKIEAKYKK